MSQHAFTCDSCNREIIADKTTLSGYGLDKNNNKICYECCAIKDSVQMSLEGKIVLYLNTIKDCPIPQTNIGQHQHYMIPRFEVTNWPGTLRYPVTYSRIGKHNIAKKVYVVYFTGPDGAQWTGKTYGDNTQLCHCKRLKRQ